ncbi:MarR family transcriptional regulator [Amycolatopsis sp. H20-H5]|uniref:MarR family transcriptional regulator n=1 Tax=Amycolatopsis sp. H20-H5 TaxID=3046309 RepID=UPI002DBAD85C|nr:MarR family transcriptional regulator [Amycolatopsis sp. H20-H5]MEC3981787.1 MarR family transcriptional regulator [Amycolatopsis sp. H20-H5]
MQTLTEAGPDLDEDVAALEALTRVLVGIAWDGAHAAPPGVTFPQTRLLLILDGLGRVPSSRLAAAMGVNASSVTRLADRLETHGYLARGRDRQNRSVVTVEVTETGRRAVAHVLERRRTAFRALLDRMPPAQRKAATAAARRIVKAAAGVPAIGTAGPGPL